MAAPDLLFAVRNYYYLGAYQHAISEASDLENLGEAEKVELDSFVYRSYIELGSYELVINEVSTSSPQTLQAVKLLAQYQGAKLTKEDVLKTLGEWLQDPTSNSNSMVVLVAGTIYTNEGDNVEALKALHNVSTLETLAVSVVNYLRIDRVDQAEKTLKTLFAIDDDSIITQLATAWVGIFLGGAKVQEASTIFQELGDKYNWTVRLLNGAAACNMAMERWEEAEAQLLEAIGKDAKSADTLANLVTVSAHLGKPASRYIAQLNTVAPAHIVVQRAKGYEEAFTHAAAALTA